MIAVRVSDRERDMVVARLGGAAAEGRLTLVEYDERCGLAYAARTAEQLDALVADLPPATPARPGVSAVAVLASAAGLGWMPLFPYLDYAAAAGAVGVLLGAYELRTTASGLSRVLAVVGLLGGVAGVALQVFWLVFTVIR